MDDISIQLRRWSTAIADAAHTTPIDELTAGTGPDRSRRRLLAAAASIVVVAAGIVALAVFDDDTDRAPSVPADSSARPTSTEVATTSASTTTALNEPAADRLADWPTRPSELLTIDAVPLLVPMASIPEVGPPIWSGIEPLGDSLAAPAFTQVFVNADHDVLITLQTQPDTTETTPPSLRRAVEIDGWDSAFQSRDCDTCPVRLVATEPSGWIRLTGTGLSEAEAETIVGGLQRRDAGVPGWDLPAGSEFVEVSEAWNSNFPERQLIWYLPGESSWRAVAEMHVSPGLPDLVDSALGTEFERVDINGVEGWYSSMFSTGTVVWSPDGATTVVLRVSDAGVDALTLARSVIEVDPETYYSMTTTEWPEGLGDGCQSLFC